MCCIAPGKRNVVRDSLQGFDNSYIMFLDYRIYMDISGLIGSISDSRGGGLGSFPGRGCYEFVFQLFLRVLIK